MLRPRTSPTASARSCHLSRSVRCCGASSLRATSRFTSAPTSRGAGEDEASLDCLWWPPHKISGRYLAPFLYHDEAHAEHQPPGRSLDVEVALPVEWHAEPMALDPYRSPEID